MSQNDFFDAELIDVGRSKFCGKFKFKSTRQLHAEVQKHLGSKGWDMVLKHEGETTDTYEVLAGYRCVGLVLVNDKHL